MIKLDKGIVEGVRAAASAEELHQYLQKAIELEHSTIPPYLTAMFSLKPGVNDMISRLIRSIILDEMLHMAISANILVAIGGHPRINMPGFIPGYPGPLPMSIGGAGFTVGIEAFSLQLVQQTFMVIEEPEHPIPVQREESLAAVPDFATIGQFYQAIQEKIRELGDGIFVVPPSHQVLQWFPSNRLFPIIGVESAVAAIDIIMIEGEGTSTDPFESGDKPSHYYKFGEIFAGQRLIKTSTGYAYGGEIIPFEPAGVYPMMSNPKAEDFEPGTQVRARIEKYSYDYSNLLNVLHKAFNGEPALINTAMGLMYSLKMDAVALMQTPIGDGSGMTAGPSYVYTNTQGGMGSARR